MCVCVLAIWLRCGLNIADPIWESLDDLKNGHTIYPLVI